MIRRLLPFAAFIVLGCSSSSADPPATPSDTGTTPNVIMVGQGGTVFVPSTLTVKVGQTVTWKWAASGHSVTSGDSAACTPDSKFDSTILATGATFTQKFDTAGTVNFFCLPHCGAGMKGSIIVTP